jgi:hypothetical protein
MLLLLLLLLLLLPLLLLLLPLLLLLLPLLLLPRGAWSPEKQIKKYVAFYDI